MIPYKTFEDGPRAFVTIHRVWEDVVIVKATTFAIHEPVPHNQYRRSQVVTYVEKRRRNWIKIVPDNASYLTIQDAGNGHLIYDSRETIPCHMGQFDLNRAECQDWQRAMQDEEDAFYAEHAAAGEVEVKSE
jgi:hypothetical protein